MAIISFAKTVDEFLSGKKRDTRRDWSKAHTEMWQHLYDKGHRVHYAYDKSPRNGGKKIGELILTSRPFRAQLCGMDSEDLLREGDMCKTIREFCKFIGKKPEDYVTVVRFRKVKNLQ